MLHIESQTGLLKSPTPFVHWMLATKIVKRFDAKIKAISSLCLPYIGCLLFSTTIW